MAKKKKAKKDNGTDEATYGNPLFPYCTVPKSLRRFLETVPTKPKPPKITGGTLKVWGFRSSNDISILRVLKELGLLSSAGEPTTYYAGYMNKETGAAVLGARIKAVYEGLFQNVTNPEKASNDELKSFFNIHSGGGEKTIRFQIETFKALAAYATFGETDPLEQSVGVSIDEVASPKGAVGGNPAIRIDLHIHLPENKTKADYDAILESIANHLYK